MTRSSSRSFLLLLLAGSVLVLGLGLLALLRGGERRVEPAVARLEPEPAPAAPGPSPELVAPPEVERLSQEEVADTTVLWPLQIDLHLLQASYLPAEASVERVGSGRTAQLSGQLAGPGGEGLVAQVRFVAGPNAGTVLHADSTGRFGSSTLYPGLALVEVRAGSFVARREVRLRQGAETLLNLGFGRLATVAGIVLDAQGQPVGGAEVNFDGHLTTSGEDGMFYVAGVAGGQIPVEVGAPGFAALRQTTYVAGGTIPPREEYRLQPAASLRIAIPDRVGGPGPVQVYLLPNVVGSERTEPHQQAFPWHRLHPLEVPAGASHVVDGLPATSVRILAFRPGARAQEKIVNLQAGQENDVTIRLEGAPMILGTVVDEGRPVAAARVRLEAPNRVKATLGFFVQTSMFLESEILPDLPPATQEAVTGPDGRFLFTAWDELGAVRYLEARSADGRAWAGRLVRPGDGEIRLELEEEVLGNAALELFFPDRWQGLPVELSVNGAPLDPHVVPPHEPLRVASLVAGRWQLRARWRGEVVQPEVAFDLEGETEREIRLPQEAIDGQDEEAWRRAGREFPFPSGPVGAAGE